MALPKRRGGPRRTKDDSRILLEAVLAEHCGRTSEKLEELQEVERTIKGLAEFCRGDQLASYHQRWEELSTLRKFSGPRKSNLINYYKGCLMWKAVKVLFTDVPQQDRQWNVLHLFLQNVLNISYANGSPYLSFFVLGWNREEFRYFEGFSLLKYACALKDHMVAHGGQPFNTNPFLDSPPQFPEAAGRVEVRPSKIHGLGLFATAHIKTGEEIAAFQGEVVDRDTYRRVYPKGTIPHHLLKTRCGRRWEVQGPSRYSNEPVEGLHVFANAAFVDVGSAGKGGGRGKGKGKGKVGDKHPWKHVAIQDIKAGEEIITRYDRSIH
jgi:hypothetical protein